MTDKILKLPEVMNATALSRSSVYSFISKGRFPKAIPLGDKAVGWLASEVAAWISERALLRDNSEPK